MSDLLPVTPMAAPALPGTVALPPGAPGLGQLFAFAEDAERRFERLRMAITEQIRDARGERTIHHEIVMRHPGLARVTRRRGDTPLSRDFDVWLTDGRIVRTYDALDRVASARPLTAPPIGADHASLPEHARLRPVVTPLPAGSLADAFVHPRGLLRRVVASGPHALVGTARVCGRETLVVRAEHPRVALVHADRPDRRLVVGIDRMSGLVLLLSESFGDVVTRHAEVVAFDLDGAVPDSAFELHLGADDRLIY